VQLTLENKLILEQQLEEGLGSNTLKLLRSAGFATHLFLDVVGIVADFAGVVTGGVSVPIGIAADTANAILYLVKQPPKYLDAGLSLMSTLPALGDVLGKGGKVAKSFSKAIKGMKTVKKGKAMGKPGARIIATLLPKALGGGKAGYKALRTAGPMMYRLGSRITRAIPNLLGLLKKLGQKHDIFNDHADGIVSSLEQFSNELMEAPEELKKIADTEEQGAAAPQVADQAADSLNEEIERLQVLAGIQRKNLI
jgi:hypothetical protein